MPLGGPSSKVNWTGTDPGYNISRLMWVSADARFSGGGQEFGEHGRFDVVAAVRRFEQSIAGIWPGLAVGAVYT